MFEPCPTDRDDLVDTFVAARLTAKMMNEPPDCDHIFMSSVGVCGHVASGNCRKMDRTHDAPINEWFQLGTWDDAGGVLFFVRSMGTGEEPCEDDIIIARRFIAYSNENDCLPWDIVFCHGGDFTMASDLIEWDSEKMLLDVVPTPESP